VKLVCRVLTERHDFTDDLVADGFAWREGHTAREIQAIEIASADDERAHQGFSGAAQLRIVRLAPFEATRFDEDDVAHREGLRATGYGQQEGYRLQATGHRLQPEGSGHASIWIVEMMHAGGPLFLTVARGP
jgi:hypothetical protein